MRRSTASGSTARAGDIVRTYSLGMKQRLGIAAALLKDPALLILDEPANGLDPAGIVEVRDLLRSLGAEGRTVFVSSHILSEVQQMPTASRSWLGAARRRGPGPRGPVLRSDGRRRRTRRRSRGGPRRAPGRGSRRPDRRGPLRVAIPPAEGARIARVLADRALYPSLLQPDEGNLEQAFLELTGDDHEVGA